MSPRALRNWRPREVERFLRANGFLFRRQEGSHRRYLHPATGRQVTVPFHPGTIKAGTFRSIVRQSGIPPEGWRASLSTTSWGEARKVRGLRVDAQKHAVRLEGNARQALEGLVAQYERLFGRASREVCRDAVRPLVGRVLVGDIPDVLR